MILSWKLNPEKLWIAFGSNLTSHDSISLILWSIITLAAYQKCSLLGHFHIYVVSCIRILFILVPANAEISLRE